MGYGVNMHGKVACGVVLCALFMGSVQAQLRNSGEQAPGFHGGATVGVVYNDNILRSESDTVDDKILTLTPDLNYKSLFSKHTLNVGYQGGYAFYSDRDNENVDDHALAATLNLDLTEKLDVDLEGGYQWLHDPRGASGTRLLRSDEPDKREVSHLSAQVTYGRRTNQGQFVAFVESMSLEYTNNDQQARDRDRLNFSGTFYYNMTGKTSWLLEVRYSDIDYVDDISVVSLDSQERHYLVGARWEATGLTSGEIRVGRVEKDLDQAGRDDFSGFALEGEIEWTPLARDAFTFSVRRSTSESTQGSASYFVSTSFGGQWGHVLTPLWGFSVTAMMREDDYSDDRNDDLRFLSFAMNYSLSARMSLAGTYSYSERDSNTDGADYESNAVMFTLAFQPG